MSDVAEYNQGHTLLTFLISTTEGRVNDQSYAQVLYFANNGLLNTPNKHVGYLIPLYYAMRFTRDERLITTLLNLGTNTVVFDEERRSPLFLFFYYINWNNVPSLKTARQMIFYSRDIINTKSKAGFANGVEKLEWTPFHQFLVDSSSFKDLERVDLTKFFLHCGADPFVVDRLGNDAFNIVDKYAVRLGEQASGQQKEGTGERFLSVMNW